MNTTRALVEAHQAQDTESLLDNIAWTDVILPALRRTRDQWTTSLVSMTLGAQTTSPLTREQIAGRIYGIDFMIKTMEEILKRGRKAEEYLSTIGVSV